MRQRLLAMTAIAALPEQFRPVQLEPSDIFTVNDKIYGKRHGKFMQRDIDRIYKAEAKRQRRLDRNRGVA